MNNKPIFVSASPYENDILALPVTDVDAAAAWYGKHFGMQTVERRNSPLSVIMERNGVQIGFAVNGRDPEQEGAAVRVRNIAGLIEEFRSNGLAVPNERIDEREGQSYKVFFVVAPDGLCYYFHEPVDP